MQLEDVVHVLRKVHKALRPHGVLLDIHPVPAHHRVEVLREGHRSHLGYLDSSAVIERVRDARARLRVAQREGLFELRARRYFDWDAHYSTIEAWFRRRDEYGSMVRIPPELLRRLRRHMRRAGSTFVLSERTRADLLVKVN
jgi:hypothetical protein